MSDTDSLDYDSDDKEKATAEVPDVEAVSDGEDDVPGPDEADLIGLNLQPDHTHADAGTAQAIFDETSLPGDDIALSDEEPEEDSCQKCDQDSKLLYIESLPPEAKLLNMMRSSPCVRS